MPAVMWFRRDLRVRDNPALLAALEDGTVTALFVVDPAIWSGAGPARRAWLAATVLALGERIPLTIRHGDPRDVVPRVAGGRRVHVSAETTPYGRRRDEAVGEQVELVATGSPYAVGPGRVRNGSGNPYQVFSAFARAWREHGWPEPAATPRSPDLAPADSQQEAVELLEKAVADAPFDLPGAGEDAVRAVELVREAGGVPVMAHPFAAPRGRVVDDAVIELMVDAGLAGLEVHHRDHDVQATAHAADLVKRLGLLATGSSDFHGAGKPNRLGEHTTDPAVLDRLEEQATSGTHVIRPGGV